MAHSLKVLFEFRARKSFQHIQATQALHNTRRVHFSTAHSTPSTLPTSTSTLGGVAFIYFILILSSLCQVGSTTDSLSFFLFFFLILVARKDNERSDENDTSPACLLGLWLLPLAWLGSAWLGLASAYLLAAWHLHSTLDSFFGGFPSFRKGAFPLWSDIFEALANARLKVS